MKFRWHREARAEADTAAAFYNDQHPGLAQRFFDDLEEALRRIQRHPLAYR
jgi:plasmid stabilization system protein ParE